MSRRQLTIKPSCTREISAFPADRAGLLWAKIDQLVADPFPDGKVKKKLKVGDGLYRMRVADHRVIYRFGEDWVSLLGVRRRQEDTYAALPDDKDPLLAPEDDDDDLDALLGIAAPKEFHFDVKPAERPLPEPLNLALLRRLGVPMAAAALLLRCTTEDELLAAAVPGEVLSVVLDHLFPATLAGRDQQPDLLVASTEDLVRYKAGDLLGFLLRLDEDQLALTRWALQGPTMVRGGAGTGKSTVALYRVKALLERAGATGNERVLFTTYTRALLTVTQQLLQQLLTPTQLERVVVSTSDQVVYEIVSTKRKLGNIESSKDAARRLAELRRRHVPGGGPFESKLRERALARLADAWLLEEFDWIIEGRGLASLEEYLSAPRPGRGLALNERARTAVWELYSAFAAAPGVDRYPALRREARQLLEAGNSARYDYVIVDEAQDLSPVSLALMAELAISAEGLFFAADNKQSLYSRNYSWNAAHPRLNFRGRTALLQRNYRSTREIDRAAFAVLHAESEEAIEASTSIHEGPLPVLVRGIEPEKQGVWIERFIRQMARHLRLKPSASAVLVPTGAIGAEIAAQLVAQGLDARFYQGRELDLRADLVRVLTLHSAKGLEFPIVVIAGLDGMAWPVPEDFEEPELFAERARHERRLLYVGMTRAMRGLMVVEPVHCRHPALVDLDVTHWHVEHDGEATP